MPNDRGFVWGIMAGIIMIIGCTALASEVTGVKLQPIPDGKRCIIVDK